MNQSLFGKSLLNLKEECLWLDNTLHLLHNICEPKNTKPEKSETCNYITSKKYKNTKRCWNQLTRDTIHSWKNLEIEIKFIPMYISMNSNEHVLRFKKIGNKIENFNVANHKSSEFTVKLSRAFLNRKDKIKIATIIENIDDKLWELIHKNSLPPKIKAHTWKVITKNIITNLRSKHWTKDPFCHFCQEEEDIKHRYFLCVVAKYWWTLIMNTLDIPAWEWKEIIFLKIIGNEFKLIGNVIFQITLWFINKNFYQKVIGEEPFELTKERAQLKCLLEDTISTLMKSSRKLKNEAKELSNRHKEIGYSEEKITFDLKF